MTSRRSVQWSTSSPSTFLVSSASELRLCEHVPSRRQAQVKTLAVCSDLPTFKSLAWSPDPLVNDLVAVGLSTGRTILLRIHETPVYTSGSNPSILNLNVKTQRSCNIVAFSPTEPHILVTGYDKVRDHSLLVWDIRGSFSGPASVQLHSRKSSVDASGTSSLARPKSTAAQTSDFKPIAQFGQSEQVSAATFLHSAGRTLIAAVQGKWIRSYDLRSPTSPGGGSSAAAVMHARNVHSLVADPFDHHRFSSVSDDGLVRLWDLRQVAEPLLTFSSEDGIASFTDRNLSRSPSKASLGPTASAGPTAGQVTSMAFSTTKRGYFATLDRDASFLSAWNIFDIEDVHSAKGPETPGPSMEAIGMDQPQQEVEVPQPTLYYERRTSKLSRPLTSFAFVPGTGGPQQFVTVNRDGGVELCEVKQSPQLAFATSGQLAYSKENSVTVEGDKLALTHVRTPALSRPGTIGSLTPRNTSRDRLTVGRPQVSASRPASPPRGRRPRRQDTDESKLRLTDDEDSSSRSRLPLLEKDISIVMRQRAEKGYGLDPARNRRLTEDGLAELWSWIEHAANMSQGGRAYIDHLDFGFKGVLPILKGFPANEAGQLPQPAHHVASRRGRTASSNTTVFDDVRTSLKRGDAARAQEAAFARAAEALNKKNGSKPFTISSKPAQRQLALSSIGPDFASADVPAVIKRYERSDQPAKAAAWALFSGNVELAVQSLRNNKDERLKLLAPILASHMSHRHEEGINSSFRELCASLSTDLDDPFMRAIFAYLATGDWNDVLEEDALPLRDRIGIALRFLQDDELYRTLEAMAKKATNTGDLEALPIVGLERAGFTLLQSYVDRTGDVQTAALAAAFVHPGQYNDPRAERWIESYRKMLDHWKMYTIRARFDIARGSKMRNSLTVKGAEETSAAVGALIAPPHMLIRCHFCNETISPRKHDPPAGSSQVMAKGRRPVQTFPNARVTHCPHCSKPFPRCAICLESIEVSINGNATTCAWCWCQRCRHGGHAPHFLEWFDRGNQECPVADCNCHCREPR